MVEWDAPSGETLIEQPEALALQTISSPRVRNLVRGVLTARTDDAFTKTMASLHRECTEADAATVGRILQSSILNRYSKPAQAYPEKAGSGGDLPFYAATRLDLELSIQQFRLDQADDRLFDAIALVGRTNQALLDGDLAQVERLFACYRASFGTSMMMALKALSLRNSSLAEEAKAFDDGPVLIPFRRPRRLIVAAAFEDMSDRDRDYMRLRRFFTGIATGGRLPASEAALLRELLSPLGDFGNDIPNRLEAFGRLGLLDLVAFLFRAEAVLTRLGRTSDAEDIASAVPHGVRRAWLETFDSKVSADLQDFVGRDDQFDDLTLFSHLPAWSEYPMVFAHRLDVECSVGGRLDGTRLQPAGGDPLVLLRSCAREIAELPVIGAPGREWHAGDGGFARTIALVAAVEKKSIEVPSGEELHMLLDRTINVPNLLTADEIDEFLPRRREDSLYEYLRTALLNDADGGALREHALRRAVEHLLKERFDGDVLRMIKALDSADGHVSKHLFNLFSETFLSNLYGLYRLADDVMEAQTRLLEWEGERRDNHDAALRAKSLRLLIRLRKVRGSIEETRIHVDPLRFLEWLHEHLEDEVRAVQPLAADMATGDDVFFNAADTVTNSVQPRSRLLGIIDRAYGEFAANKVHGAASYIGRRVRHGKFNGHLAVEMKPAVDAAVAELAALDAAFADFLKRWYRELDTATHDFARERIHVRTKAKPRGLIVASIDDPDKAPVLRVAMTAIASAFANGAPLSQVMALLLDYCWLLIEVDLKRTRIEIEELRRRFVIDAEQHITGRLEIDARITEHARALNSELGQRFEAAKSWLTRRANAAPSASVALMVEAVLDEVSQRFEFQPEVELPEDLSLDLIGHSFHFFYDTLWILVSNAAEYGRRDGGLKVTVTTRADPDGRYVNMTVKVASRFVAEDKARQIGEIDTVMSADIGDAMDRDGGTGLRKLRSLVEEASEIVGFDRIYDGDRVEFAIRSRYPLS